MIKFFLIISIFLITFAAWACPGCAGGISSGKTQWTLIILSIFIVATYIPFYILFKAAKTYDPKNSVDDNE